MRDYSTAGVDPTISSLEIEAQERLLTKIKPSLWLKSTGSRTKVFSQKSANPDFYAGYFRFARPNAGIFFLITVVAGTK